jgi:serine protease Do
MRRRPATYVAALLSVLLAPAPPADAQVSATRPAGSTPSLSVPAPAPAAAPTSSRGPYCIGDYADDLSQLAPRARELERQPYSFCVRTTATYECLSYAVDGSVRRSRMKVVAHGTAFAYRQIAGATTQTLLLTNDHVAEWPAVTDDDHPVDGVPLGCKRVADSLRIVESEDDDYDPDDIPLTRVVTDPQLDAAILKANTALPILPWKIGRSAALRVRNVVEVRGFPLGAFQATNIGKVVSAYDHDDYKDWDHDDFVIDALLSAGNSGSPVLAVSCQSGEFELVGLYHAGYTEGSALNVAIGIDQLRDMMTTLKRSPRAHNDAAVTLDEAARGRLLAHVEASFEPFFPLGALTASIRARPDGALLFELYPKEFPFRAQPIFAFEDLPQAGAFGAPGRYWFGSLSGVRRYQRADLDAEAQAQVAHLVAALRHDAVAFFGTRALKHAAASRAQFEHLARLERSLQRTVAGRHDLDAAVADLAERLAPHQGDPSVPLDDLFTLPAHLPPPAPLAPPPPASPMPRPPRVMRRAIEKR